MMVPVRLVSGGNISAIEGAQNEGDAFVVVRATGICSELKFYFVLLPTHCLRRYIMGHKKVFHSLGVFLLLAMMLSTAAFATSGLDAHCVVPANNGSAYGKQSGIKEVDGSSAYLYDAKVGGGYEVDVRQWDKTNRLGGAWTRDVSSTNNAAHLAGHVRMFEGDTIQIEFSSNLLTFVSTEVNGTWDTN